VYLLKSMEELEVRSKAGKVPLQLVLTNQLGTRVRVKNRDPVICRAERKWRKLSQLLSSSTYVLSLTETLIVHDPLTYSSPAILVIV
jgi:hypothetical protein